MRARVGAEGWAAPLAVGAASGVCGAPGGQGRRRGVYRGRAAGCGRRLASSMSVSGTRVGGPPPVAGCSPIASRAGGRLHPARWAVVSAARRESVMACTVDNGNTGAGLLRRKTGVFGCAEGSASGRGATRAGRRVSQAQVRGAGGSGAGDALWAVTGGVGVPAGDGSAATRATLRVHHGSDTLITKYRGAPWRDSRHSRTCRRRGSSVPTLDGVVRVPAADRRDGTVECDPRDLPLVDVGHC